MSVQNLSLSSVANADTYFGNKLFASIWASQSSDTKQQALNTATFTINQFDYLGKKTDPAQPNEWPRQNIYYDCQNLPSDTIPDLILFAQYELALAFVKGYDPEREIRSLRVTSRGYSSVRTTYDYTDVPDNVLVGVPSAIAWGYLSPFFNRERNSGIDVRKV